MTTLGIIAATVGAWTILACTGVAGFSLVATRLKRKATATAEQVNWLPFTPPVPPPAPRLSDDWLDQLPVEVLAADEIDRRFYRLIGGAR